MPRLFSKFAIISRQELDLDFLFQKSIIEAHGGKMWASNNDANQEKEEEEGIIYV
jgi:hypothetical protein